MTDSHCHLTACEEPLEAASPELRALVSVGTDPEDSERTLELAERLPNVWVALGIHPNSAGEATAEARSRTEALFSHPKVVGVGETGFDTYWDAASLEAQRNLFFWHAECAAEYQKPLILHVRDKAGRETASQEAARCLASAEHRAGILHCFNGHQELLRVGLELGWYVSFAGNATYKNAGALRKAAAQVPASRLLVETDSPYLTPQPKRGERNVPRNVRYTAMMLAELRGVSLTVLEGLIDDNAARVYGLSGAATESS